jgi:N-methylhydantoinase B
MTADARQRQGMAPHFHFGYEPDAHERIWTAEAYAAMTEIMMALPIHWRFFVKTRLFAMLTTPAADAAGAVRDGFAQLRTTSPGLGG